MNDEYLIYGETLKGIADSIRSVSSVSTAWTPDEMAAYILANLVKPTTRQAAKTYTPGTSNQTIPAGTFLTGAATIQGDADWVESNIKKGVNMWGKTGTLDGIWGVPGSLYGFTKVVSGSFTVSSATTSMSLTHGFGTVPKLIIITGGTFHEIIYQTCTDKTVGTNTAAGKTSSGEIYYYSHSSDFYHSVGYATTSYSDKARVWYGGSSVDYANGMWGEIHTLLSTTLPAPAVNTTSLYPYNWQFLRANNSTFTIYTTISPGIPCRWLAMA